MAESGLCIYLCLANLRQQSDILCEAESRRLRFDKPCYISNVRSSDIEETTESTWGNIDVRVESLLSFTDVIAESPASGTQHLFVYCKISNSNSIYCVKWSPGDRRLHLDKRC